MMVPLSPGISLGPNLAFFVRANNILSNLSDFSATNAVNEKRLWIRTVHLMEDLLWGKYQHDS